ncbi:MAG: hypothetical protein AAFZ18_24035 [Myxococcota bacterium]
MGEIGPNFVVADADVLPESVGIGVNGIVGFHLHVGSALFVVPELKLGFESPGTPNAFRVLGGVRVGLRQSITPVAFAHVGGLVGDLEGFAWDAGAGLRFNFASAWSLGVTGAYNRAEAQIFTGSERPYEWVSATATLAVVL